MITHAPMLTVSNQYGSGGSQIARIVGDRLQWPVWDKEIVRKIAEEYQVAETDVDDKDERRTSVLERVVGVLGVGGFATAYNMLPPGIDDDRLLHMTRTIVEDIARTGRAIIVGRGGNHILAKRPRTLHVFVFAPLEARVRRVAAAEKFTRTEAERRVSGMDKLRTDYVRSFYHADWRDPTNYNLTVDSSVWGDAATAEVILAALERMSDQH
jgi:cytidylate kinase